jgi:nitrous oxidase accessory protein NosD
MNLQRKAALILLFASFITSMAIATQSVRASATIDVYPGPGTPIQTAISGASPGDTIIVHAGVYDEQVVIAKALTLEGVGYSSVIRPSGSATLASVYTTAVQGGGAFWDGQQLASIIIVQNVGTGTVTVSNLQVDGININSAPAAFPSAFLVGVTYGESSGTIQGVKIVNMDTTSYQPRSYGIWMDAVNTLASVTASGCTIVHYNRNGILARGAKLTVDIGWNVITGPSTLTGAALPNGIFITFGAGGTVHGNTVSSNHYSGPTYLSTGIGGYSAKDGVMIDDNEVYDTDVGISPSSNSPITDNSIHDCLIGIELESGSADNSISCNCIHNNYFGIHLLGPGSIYYSGAGDEPGPGNTASCNNIYGNTEGVRNWDATQTFMAEKNWWGSPTGPQHLSNPGGSGDKVSDYVDFTPWLTSKACQPVGGEWMPVDTFALLARLAVLFATILALTGSFVYVRRKTGF